MNKIPMTVEGEAKLRAELEHLKKVERPRIVAAIAEAREQQSFAEGRIQEIEGKLSHAQVIDIAQIPASNKVIFGSTVNIVNLETDAMVTYQIVGDDEADVKVGKISYQSPIARALIGKEVGDEVVVKTPAGDVDYEIDGVRHI